MTIAIFNILCLVIVVLDSQRLSVMGKKESLIWVIVWMAMAYFSTMWLTRLSMQDIFGILNLQSICILGCIELLIYFAYLFNDGKVKRILSHYPGLMMIFPVMLLALWLSRVVSGANFNAIGLIAAVIAGVVLSGIIFFLRWLRSDNAWLYLSTISCLIIYILIYGIL